MELEPLGDTPGCVVNLQSGAVTSRDELEILSRNCQLAPGGRAMMQRKHQVDPENPAQHRANSKASKAAAEKPQREAEESMRIIEASTPEA